VGRPIPPRGGYLGDAAPGGLIVSSMTTLSPFLIWRSASGETRASNESRSVLILILPSRSTSVTVPYTVCRTPSGTAARAAGAGGGGGACTIVGGGAWATTPVGAIAT